MKTLGCRVTNMIFLGANFSEALSNCILYGITQEVLESGSPAGEEEEEGSGYKPLLLSSIGKEKRGEESQANSFTCGSNSSPRGVWKRNFHV